METTTLEITENEFLRQFEARFDDTLVTIEYSVHPRNIFLTKLVMDDKLIEKGYDQLFLVAIFDYFKENNTKVVPTASKIVSFFRKNRKEYKELLPVGISI